MSKKDIELTGYCGLYCGDCIRYKSKASDLARDLLAELQATGFDRYAEGKSLTVKEFKNFVECCRVLEEITKLQCNRPCRGGKGCATFSCEVIKCCRSKRYEGCWECSDFEKCYRFEFIKPLHGENSINNLKIIREMGLSEWAQHRHKFYNW